MTERKASRCVCTAQVTDKADKNATNRGQIQISCWTVVLSLIAAVDYKAFHLSKDAFGQCVLQNCPQSAV